MSIAIDVANKLFGSEARFAAESSLNFIRKNAAGQIASEEDLEDKVLFHFSDGSQYSVKKDGELNPSVNSPEDKVEPIVTVEAGTLVAEETKAEEAPAEEASAPIKAVTPTAKKK